MSPTNKTPSPESLSAMIDSIKVFFSDHEHEFDKADKRIVESFPSKARILEDMDDSERDVMYRSVRHLWVKMTGKEPEFESVGSSDKYLDGAYWMLPGGVLIAGYNHYMAARDNKFFICSMLDINPLIFEKLLLAGDVNGAIGIIVARGGVRVLINRGKKEVVMQTNEASWPWVKGKLDKMYHKNKFAKVVDMKQPYEGWESGVTIKVK